MPNLTFDLSRPGGGPATPIVSATVDAGALRHNLSIARRRAPGSRVMAVLKADAYGHGLAAAAAALDGADAFAVARLEEGLNLRAAGVAKPVVLLEGVLDRDQLAAAAAGACELVLHTSEQIDLLRAAGGCRFKVWLKLDSGMHRLGLQASEFLAALDALNQLPAVQRPVNLFTHLASADEPQLATTAQQLQRFDALTASLPGERSIANSAAMLNFPRSCADWVRPGLLLYGVSPIGGTVGRDYGLRPAMTLQSRIIAVKTLGAGEQVGYGGAWTAARPTRLAIAGIGYGDGYPRSLRSGAPVLVGGRRAPLAGRVSMGMIGIDVTDLPEPVRLGDPVVLWGPDLPVEEIAVWAGTIPYELLCGISSRVPVALS